MKTLEKHRENTELRTRIQKEIREMAQQIQQFREKKQRRQRRS
jgi:hypothetical protein